MKFEVRGQTTKARSGQTSLSGPVGALIGAGVALPLAFGLWGFSVDDAFIPARVAVHLLEGLGPRFNGGGPVTDAVTPLGFAHWLATLTWLASVSPTPLGVLDVARVSGFLAWLAAASVLGRDLARLEGAHAKNLVWGWLALLTCVPLGAWAGSGLETPWVTLLATWALGRRPGATLSSGLAAALRPELTIWAVVLALFRWRARRPEVLEAFSTAAKRLFLSLGPALGPALGVASIRWFCWGRVTPLALLAKEPNFSLGLRYVLGALLLAGPFWLLASRQTMRVARNDPELGALLAAAGAHLVSVLLAGGDWMPFFRLLVPILPSVVLVGAAVSMQNQRLGSFVPLSLRAAVMTALAVLLLVGRGGDARKVMVRRTQLALEGRAELASSQRVAAVDVGWIGAATEADLVDLAGVTNPKIAALPGGHTTKRVPPALLGVREVDTLVFLAERGQPASDWARGAFVYGVEARLAPAASAMGFRLQGRLPLAGTSLEYLVAKRRLSPDPRLGAPLP